MKKRVFAILMTFAMLFSLLPATALAADTYVAKIGDATYPTFDEAITAANALTGDVTVEIYGKVEYSSTTADLTGAYDSISFVGKADDAEISITRDGSNGYISGSNQGNDCTVNFTDLTLSKPTGAYANDAGFMNVYFTVYRVGAVNYTNCVFPDGACAQGCPVTYTDCEFANTTSGEYSLWVYANTDVTVTGGSFTGVRGAKMYTEGTAVEDRSNLTLDGVTFTESVTQKPAIVLTYGASVTLKNNTYPAKGVFELDVDGAPNGTTVTADTEEIAKITCVNDNGACGVLVNGKIYTTVAEAKEVAEDGDTVTLLHNSTETVELPAGVTLNKNGYTADGVTESTGSGTEDDPYLINNLEDLKAFRDAVNTYQSDGSNQYKGKYVKLTADIDLEGENWEPIGTNSVGDHMAFLGTFDGDGHTISNLYINSDGGHLGFFARVGSYAEDVTPTVKNLIFENVDVSANVTNHWTTGHGDYVGGVIANAGGNSVISNVKVTGDVYVVGCGYVGGIVGHGYPDIDNCHVIANDGSYVQAGYWCAGGIIGYAGEGGTPITNCSVSGLDIWSAYGAAAAVTGLLQDGNTMTNVSASNVEISSNSDYVMGYIAGNGEASTLTNVTMTNVTATANGNTIAATDMVAQLADKTVYKTIGEAIAAAGSGETITLLSDIALTESLDISKEGTYTIDGNGNTISGGALRFNGTNCDLKDIVFEDCIRGNYAAVEFVNSESTITDCVFRNNAVDVIAIDCDVTKGTGTSEVSIVNCVFENNTSHSASVINHSDGTSCEITNCDFINNTGTFAVVYISDDASVTGCYFSGNTLTGSNENKAAVLAGPYDELDQTTYYEVVINGNAFLDPDFPGVWMEDWEETYGAVTTYDISNNYWLDGNSPVKDTDYGVTRDPVAANSSYADKYVRNDSKPGVTVSTYSAPVYIPAALTCKVTVSDTTDGTVKADTSYAAKGQTVTITVDPDKGYVLETLTVLDEDSKEIELTKVSDTKYTFEMPASTVTVEATFMEDNTMLNYFVDVFASDYYYDAVLWAVENGITNGTSATTFSPDAVCTRAQVVTFLWRAAGSPEPKSTDMPFADVAANAYYYDAVLWAVENGITNGTGADTFSPDADCTRAQIVTFLWRSQGCEDAAAYNPFADVESDAYYTEAVLWAVEEAITNGTSATTFSPDADCTRAQIVTFLWRCLNK